LSNDTIADNVQQNIRIHFFLPYRVWKYLSISSFIRSPCTKTRNRPL